jgi:hypothetical protein
MQSKSNRNICRIDQDARRRPPHAPRESSRPSLAVPIPDHARLRCKRRLLRRTPASFNVDGHGVEEPRGYRCRRPMRQQDEPGTAAACGSLGWFPPTYDDGRDADELAIIGAGDEGAGRCRSAWRNFLYLFCHYFRKIIGRIKIFDKCIYDAVVHGVRLLPPHPAALRPYRRGERRQESNSCASAASTAPGTCRRAARRQALNAVPHGGRPLTSCYTTTAEFFKEFLSF